MISVTESWIRNRINELEEFISECANKNHREVIEAEGQISAFKEVLGEE